MIVEGRAVSIPQDNVDTDVLYPGPYLNIQDPAQMKDHLFEGFDPTLREKLGEDAVLVVRENFGCGSSREHVPQAMRAAGIRCLVGRSFARIFYRNSINVGLPVLECPGIKGQIQTGDEVEAEILKGEVLLASGRILKGIGLSGKPLEILEAGGLVPYTRKRIGKT